MRKRFQKLWEQLTQTYTPLVSKGYVEKTVHLLYWLGLLMAAVGFVSGIIAWIVDGQFVHFVIVTFTGLGAWVVLIIICCFLTLGVLKLTELETKNKLTVAEEVKQGAEEIKQEEKKEGEKKDA
jgi:uncharacterized membrane protein YkgB